MVALSAAVLQEVQVRENMLRHYLGMYFHTDLAYPWAADDVKVEADDPVPGCDVLDGGGELVLAPEQVTADFMHKSLY